jgi:hypothetical protein
MKEYAPLTDKLSLIFWPFLRLALFFWGGYALLDGALLHWLPGFDPPTDFWQLLGPGVLAAALLLWRLWPRLRLLETGKKEHTPLLLSIAAVATIAFGTSYLHDYLRAALGRFDTLDSPAALRPGSSPGTFYRFRHKYQAARYAGVEWQAYPIRKGRDLVLHLYVATPLLASPADTVVPATSWQGLHYSTEVSASASEADKQAAYQAFLKRTASQFREEDFNAPAGYYARMPNSDERAAYLRAARRTRLPLPAASVPILVVQAGEVSLAALRQEALYYLACWLGGGTAVFFFLLLIGRLPAVSAQSFRARHP